VERDLLRVRVPTTDLFGQTVFRYANYDTPFWARNNRTPGRWHQPGDGATQYLSLHPDGAWAELIRREGLRTESDVALVRMQMWAIALEQRSLVDYSTFEKAKAAGFDPHALVDDDYSICQKEGWRLRSEGLCGVVAPNAALPAAINITLFGRRVRATWGSLPKLASAVPTCLVAIGCPAPGLASRVRHYDEMHAGYEAYVEHLAATSPG